MIYSSCTGGGRKPIDSIRSMIVDHNKIDFWSSMAGFY